MHRKPLLELLESHEPYDEAELVSLERTKAFVRENVDCFQRSLSIGHITGAGWLLDATGTKALLTHHRKLDKWLQLGGHADGHPNVLEVALTEAREESGIERITAVSCEIFDVDVHRIPARAEVVEHDHYDVRFLLQVQGAADYRVGPESLDLKWVSRDELTGLIVDPSVLRMARKWARYVGSSAPKSVERATRIGSCSGGKR